MTAGSRYHGHQAVRSQDTTLEGEAGLPQPGAAGGLLGNIQEDLGAVISHPRTLLFLILDLELAPSLQNFLDTQEHTDTGFNPIHPRLWLNNGLGTCSLPLATWTSGSPRRPVLSPRDTQQSQAF